MHVRSPPWLQQVATPGATGFALLFAIDSFARALLATLIPLEALRALETAQGVSEVYIGVGAVGLAGSFGVPWLVRRLTRRWVYTLGGLAVAAAAGLIASGPTWSLVAGILLRAFGVSCAIICLNLYVLDYIKRAGLNRFEPLRLLFAAGAWTLGPWLGVYLAREVAPGLPYLLSALAVAVELGFFWVLRAGESPLLQARRGPLPRPLSYLPRFVAQPRLRLAWLIAFGRSCWWVMFFVYAPIYTVRAGLGEQAAGLVVSAGNAVLFGAPLWGRFAERFGVRRTLILAFAAGGLATLLVGAFAEIAWLGVALLLLGSAFVVGLDVAGNIPFLRAVRPHQRAEMTAVFMTYRDASDLATPAVFALLLKVTALPAIFVASGLSLLALVGFARFLPKRL